MLLIDPIVLLREQTSCLDLGFRPLTAPDNPPDMLLEPLPNDLDLGSVQ